MTDRDAPIKNPDRVPMVLQVIGGRVGRHEPVHVLGMEGNTPMTKIEKDGIYKDADGNYFYMAAGDVTGLDVEFSHERGGQPEKRAKQSAPENKARKAAPETKDT